MERESQPAARKLVDIVARDFPNASRVQMSFSDKWEHVETIESERSSMYIAGFPIERAFSGRHHFGGLPPEINVNLVFYRLYKFFEPWPMPQVTIEWNASQRHGRIKDFNGVNVQLQPMGQAQAWFGVENTVLWECYFEESRRRPGWQEALGHAWQVVEKDVGTAKFFTAPHEPAFPNGYREFLKGMGYAQDREYPVWWSKRHQVSTERGVRHSLDIGKEGSPFREH